MEHPLTRNHAVVLLLLGILATSLIPSTHAQRDGTLAAFRVIETLDEPRGVWPILVGVLVPLPANTARDIRLLDVTDGVTQPVNFQILDIRSAVYADSDGPARSESMVELVFFATLAPGDNRRFHVVHQNIRDEPRDEPETPGAVLSYVGEEPGIQIHTGPVNFAFHPKSGQLLNYTPLLAGWDTPLGFVQDTTNAIHHNPDIWSPPLPWGHTSSWDIEREDRTYTWQAARGPLAWRFTRSGHMPLSNRVATEVAYTAFAGMPFLMVSTTMRFSNDTRVNAVRSSELVFNRGIHTHAALMDHNQTVTTVPAYDPDNHRRVLGRLGLPPLAPDIPWLALFNRASGYGIAVVSLERNSSAPGSLTQPQTFNAHYYFNDYGEHSDPRFSWNFLYICRAEILHSTIVPQGAIFADQAAFLAFATNPGDSPDEELASLRQWAHRLRRPPRIEFDRRR